MGKFSFCNPDNLNREYPIKFCGKKWILRIFIGVLIFLNFNLGLSAIIWYNDSDLTFDYIKDLRKDLIEAAAAFLQSYSSFLLILSQAESGEINLANSRDHIASAIKSMEETVKSCNELIKNVKDPEYKKQIINDLKKFNYESLQQNNSLIATIFKDVREDLEIGEIQTIYKKMQSQCNDILERLKRLQWKMYLVFPGKQELWDLSQAYSKSMLTGQYVARVFGEIKKKREEKK